MLRDKDGIVRNMYQILGKKEKNDDLGIRIPQTIVMEKGVV